MTLLESKKFRDKLLRMSWSAGLGGANDHLREVFTLGGAGVGGRGAGGGGCGAGGGSGGGDGGDTGL
jgi:hypothetical protein